MTEIVLQKRKVKLWRCIEPLLVNGEDSPAFVSGKYYKEIKTGEYPFALINEHGENHAMDESYKNRHFEFYKTKKEYFALI